MEAIEQMDEFYRCMKELETMLGVEQPFHIAPSGRLMFYRDGKHYDLEEAVRLNFEQGNSDHDRILQVVQKGNEFLSIYLELYGDFPEGAKRYIQ